MQFNFGTGAVFGVRTDIANSSPVALGVLQDVEINFSFDKKPLYGSSQFAIANARGKGKIEGKAKAARIAAATWNALFFGQTLATGQTLAALNEAGSVPAATAYTVTAANSVKWVSDLGVSYANTGMPLTQVSGAPTTAGQYSVAAGVYTFNVADAGLPVLLNYLYTATAGFTISLANLPLGTVPTWRAVFTSSYAGKQALLQLNACTSDKLTFPTKQDDWTIPELDFEAFADAAGNIGFLSLAE